MKKFNEFHKIYESNIIDLNSVKNYAINNLGLELEEQDSKKIEFYYSNYSSNVYIYTNGKVEIYSTWNESFNRKIEKAEDLGDVISDYDTWYEEQEQQD